jgi:hypothetical protein
MVEIKNYKLLQKNITVKLGGYRRQDKVILSNFPELNIGKKIISFDECIYLVKQLDTDKCCVCEDTILFEDYIPYCMYQFSYDRMNNNIIHSIDNIRIICWGCNSYPNQEKHCSSRCNHRDEICSKKRIEF